MGAPRIGIAAGVLLRVAAIVAAGAASAGCGGAHESSSPSATESSPAASPTGSGAVTGPPPGQPNDYGFLLIKPSDVGGGLTAPQSPMLNPNNEPGVAQLFANPDSSRRLWDTIVVTADPSAAAAELAGSKSDYAGKVVGDWRPLAVGANGAVVSGASPDNSQAMTVLLFTEGKALVTLEFDSAPNDPFDPAATLDIARKQDAAITKGLPG
ncbi:hypothetical protein [Mycobacterium marseillense]|uniref:Lipoprotein LpqN n=1 Tax=Mycobacterium marseillense TaxID=701042 RepID=A0ABN5ZW30_9MYCO|nr:hypothetical protein [Mycobacterium marseillense]MCV7406201.1 hypothetical protein [Mycobacterium marseillense]MDM3975871.1 hypothetical protein [Mycobacterium marseillense]ORA93770.1 hypothetical protein BST31_10755 [Mycobacterium marseillense]BBY12719.1 hypothetical protein MMARJ_34590 [Mycobacterium marseillense]